MDQRERISRIRKDFILSHPFLGDLCLNLRVVETRELTQTMGTDMACLYYNPDTVAQWSDDQLKGVTAHEVGHCVWRHAGKEGMERMEGKVEWAWMAACEYMANHFVKDMCNLALPGNCVYSTRYASGKWTTVDVYHDLLRNSKTIEVATIDDHSMWGKAESNAPESGKEAAANADANWKVHVSRAFHNAKRKGNMPAGLERVLEDILDPVLPWMMVLANIILRQARNDYTWRKPNKRHLWRKMVFPSIHSEMIRLGYAQDTSGSMSVDELKEGFAELRGICSAFPSYELHLFACDAAVHSYQVATPTTPVDIVGLSKGGGGTDFRPVFKYIKDNEIEIDALIYFTDGYGDFPKKEPDYPVIWVIKGTVQPPFGRRIQYE